MTLVLNVGRSELTNTPIALVSLATTALMATYMISIGCVLHKRLRKKPMPTARWSLGRCGFAINCVALAYAGWGVSATLYS